MTFPASDLYRLASAWERDGRTPEARELRHALELERTTMLENLAANYAGDFAVTLRAGAQRCHATRAARAAR